DRENNSEKHSRDNNKFKDLTKIFVDIIGADTTLDKAINLAFFGQDYTTNAAANAHGKKPNDPEYLFFNELGSKKTELEMLEYYYGAFKHVGAGAAVKAAWADNTPNGGKSKIDAAYNAAKDFL